MENAKKEITDLCSSFIDQHRIIDEFTNKDPEFRKKLVQRMLKIKKVQDIMLEAITKMYPVITDHLVQQRFGKYLTRGSSFTPQSTSDSFFVTSSDNQFKSTANKGETKLMTENYDHLQDKVGIIKDIFEKYTIQEIERSQNILPERMTQEALKSKLDSSDKLVSLLTEMNDYDLPFYLDIRDISHDSWGRHIEAEKEFIEAMAKAKQDMIDLETKFIYKIG